MTKEFDHINKPPCSGSIEKKRAYDIVIYMVGNNRPRIHLEASKITITAGFLLVTDPRDEVPCEVHCYPLSVIDHFTLDVEAFDDGAAVIV